MLHMPQSFGKSLLPLAILALLLTARSSGVAGPDEATRFAPADAGEVVVVAVASTTTKDKDKSKRRKKKKAKEEIPAPAPVKPAEPDVVFAEFAFPPVIPDTDWHQEAWLTDDCLRCHETGVGDTPMIVHAGMVDLLLKAKCRSCHVFIPGTQPRTVEPVESPYAEFAFPPMIPASGSHREAWIRDDCLLCHEEGIIGAPQVRHEDLPAILLTAKCRSCHVQVRSDEAAGPQ
jgi:hypothetical protein